jgi:hypothetical protein
MLTDEDYKELRNKSFAIIAGPFKEVSIDKGFLNKIAELKEKTEILEKEEEMKWDDKKKKLAEKGYIDNGLNGLKNGLNSDQDNSDDYSERESKNKTENGLKLRPNKTNTPEIKTYKTIEFKGKTYEVDVTGLTKKQIKHKVYYFKKSLKEKR